ncbi:MAG: DUF4384 domain-containing protein, partial [Syntrophaceae bacterium]|nr:DUF4384 domain-containing protein [Syntrophaceae bacterium]
MNKILAAFMLILLLSSYGHASQSTISLGEGYACMGDSRSRKQTEEQALLDAKRNSVEKVRTYLTSETTIKDFKLESDVIRAYADASVKIVEVIKKEWYKDPSRGECYKTDIKVEVVPDESVLSKIAETAGTADDPTGPLNVKIWTDKKTYKDCDKIKVFLKGNKPFYARVVYRDASGELIQILPKRYRADNYFLGN